MASVTNPTRTTTLDAVNLMLAGIGEAPVVVLGASAKAPAQRAEQRLAEENVRIQSLPYNYFRAETVVLEASPHAVEGSGEPPRIALPANTLSWHPTGKSAHLALSENNGFVVDAITGSDVWDLGETIEVEVAFVRPFETLPQVVRWFIVCSAAISFSNSEAPGTPNLRVTADAYNEAKRAFEVADRRLRKGGLRQHNPFFRRQRGNR